MAQSEKVIDETSLYRMIVEIIGIQRKYLRENKRGAESSRREEVNQVVSSFAAEAEVNLK
jgi:hypothetical protein